MKKIFTTTGFLLLLAMAFVFPSVPSAQAIGGVPRILSYQGRLLDASGNLLGASSGTTYYFKFSIWDNATVDSGSRLWPSSAPTSVSLTVRSGVFTAHIGDTANSYPDVLDYNFNANQDIYLQIQVSSDNSSFETLSPRRRIAASSFSQLSSAVSGTTTPSSFGTTTPIASSQVTIEATSTTAIPLTLRGASGQAANLFQVQSNAGANVLFANASGGLFASSTFQTTGNSIFYGTLGIGTTSPAATFAVQGNALIAGTTTVAALIATSTLTVQGTGTSTFAGGIQGTALNVTSASASSTFANGLNLSAGCFAINGSCVGSGGLTGSGSGNLVARFTSGTALSTGVLTDTGSLVGVATTTPSTEFAVQGNVLISGNLTSVANVTATGTLTMTSTTATSTFSTGGLTVGTTQFAVQQSSGRVGIGTSTPTETLHLDGGNFLQTLNGFGSSTQRGVVSPDPGVVRGVYVSGRYAYIVGNFSPEFQIYEVSTSTPSLVGSVDAGTGEAYEVVVSGRYAYLVRAADTGVCSGTTLTGCEFQIYDISTPSSPKAVGGVDIGRIADGIYVSGRYAYILTATDSSTGYEFFIYDVSNPSQPILAGGVDLNVGGGWVAGNGIQVIGRYAYIGKDADTGTCSGATLTGCEFSIYDISNPAAPVAVGGASMAYLNALTVSGNFAYLAGETLLSVYDISNPSSPRSLYSTNLGGVNTVFVAGRYLYVGLSAAAAGSCSGTTVTGCEIIVYDIASPGAPVAVGGWDVSDVIYEISVSGRYVYVATNGTGTCSTSTFSGCGLVIYDVGGLDTPSAMIGSLETGTLQARNNVIMQGDLSVEGGMNIGRGGLMIQGPLAVAASSSYPGLTAASFANRVAVGTSTAYAQLSVYGVGTGTGQLMELVNSASTSLMMVLESGLTGIGTTSPSQLLSVQGNMLVSGNLTSVANITATGTLAVTSTTATSTFATGGLTVGTTQLVVQSSSGRVGIGTSTPTESLHLDGGNFLQTLNGFGSSTQRGVVDPGGVKGVFVSGRYAYVVDDNRTIKVYDVSTSTPSLVGSVNLADTVYEVFVSGRYAYVVMAANTGTCSGTTLTGCEFQIYDVSNPSSPRAVSGVDIGRFAMNVYVSGRYAYVLAYSDSSTGYEFLIYDISNPSSPILAGGVDLEANGGYQYGKVIQVVGRYAYIGKAANAGTCSGTTLTGCEFSIYDVSNPASPAPVGGVDRGSLTISISVSGNFAYVANYDLGIYDISNPSAPVLLTTVAPTRFPDTVFVSGRYLYVGLWSAAAGSCSGTTVTGCEIIVYDISKPGAPVAVGGWDVSDVVQEIFVAGRYVYVGTGGTGACSTSTFNGCGLVIYDLGGLDTPSAMIGSLETGTLQARNNVIMQGDLSVEGGMNIGRGGLMIQGPLAVAASSSYPGLTSASFANRVSIGTTTPYAQLSVYGVGTGTGQLMELVNSASTSLMTVLESGLTGIGTTSPAQLLSVQGNMLVSGNLTSVANITATGTLAVTSTTATSTFSTGGLTVGTNQFTVQQTSGRVGIGTSTPTESLHLDGGNFLQTINGFGSTTYRGGVDPSGDAARGVFVSGRYAYVVVGSSNDFRIYDVSTSTPSQVAAVDTGTGVGIEVFVSGRYAYITRAADTGACSGTTLTGCELQIYDISNPSSPKAVSGVDIGRDVNGVYVSGRYAYVLAATDSSTGYEFFIYDVSNPSSPILAGGVDLGVTGGNSAGNGIQVIGRYAYIAKSNTDDTCSGTTLTGCEFSIYDVSNPAAPTAVGGADLGSSGTGGLSVYVSGNFAYVGSVYGTYGQNHFQIYDISNPSSPRLLTGLHTRNASVELSTRSIVVSGRYAYVGVDANTGTCLGTTITGCEVRVYDISSPGTPVAVGGIETGIATDELFVSGRYLYIATAAVAGTCSGTTLTGCEFQIYDLGGLDVPSAMVGSLEVGTLQARNNVIMQGDLSVEGGVNIGRGGLMIQGPLAVAASSSYPGLTSASFANRVSIGTTTPYSQFTVFGAGTGTGQLFELVNSASTSVLTVLDNGQIMVPNGSLCVDADGSCSASTTGRVSGLTVTTGGTDIAEMYESADMLFPGEVVMAAGDAQVARATQERAPQTMGVVSTAPGLILGLSPDGSEGATGVYPIALSGRVPVKVNNENGAISSGDRLSLSSVPGVAMKADSLAPFTVGIALQDFAEEEGTVLTFVNLAPQVTVEHGLIPPLLAAAIEAFRDQALRVFELVADKVTAVAGYFKHLFAEEATIGSRERPSGITVFDEDTGEPYCIKVKGGARVLVPGACGGRAAPPPEPAPPPSATPGGGGSEPLPEPTPPEPEPSLPPEPTPPMP